jgi:hypothetical protein
MVEGGLCCAAGLLAEEGGEWMVLCGLMFGGGCRGGCGGGGRLVGEGERASELSDLQAICLKVLVGCGAGG